MKTSDGGEDGGDLCGDLPTWQPLLGWRELMEFSPSFPRLWSETKGLSSVNRHEGANAKMPQLC